ncbi:translation initiation factor IF-2 N-terminal domain-containing protein, partial [Terribacillus saccharophilus]|uniref:translation initiation factor IF-2 N-terminal domain-containing protein n=1 Tax=Terribacillus saccharophilus TaxID=361277 RepID=UPI003D2BC54C
MSKIRVYEYAKEKNVSSKEIITKLKDMNIEVTNHMSTINETAKDRLDKSFTAKSAGSEKVAIKTGNSANTTNSANNSGQNNKPKSFDIHIF